MGQQETKLAQQNTTSTPGAIAQTTSKNTQGNKFRKCDLFEFLPINQVQFIWIDPNINNSMNQAYINKMRSQVRIRGFASVQGALTELSRFKASLVVVSVLSASLDVSDYHRLLNDARIHSAYLFCLSRERAEQLVSTFEGRILGVFFDPQTLTERLATVNSNYKSLIRKTQILALNEDDTARLNKYRLIYSCFTAIDDDGVAKRDLFEIVKYLAKDSFKINPEQIARLEQQYSSANPFEWVFAQQSILWDLVSQLPTLSTDSKHIAYIRILIKDLHLAIKNKYRQMDSSRRPDELFIVMELDEGDHPRLRAKNFITFTSFVKGFSQKRAAMDYFLQKDTPKKRAFFEVLIPEKDDLEAELDFGFAINPGAEPNIVFNLYNFFEVVSFHPDTRKGELQYGSLSFVHLKRSKPLQRGKITSQQQALLRNYSYLEDVKSNSDGQLTLLQMDGNFEDSLILCSELSQSTDELNLRIAQAHKFSGDIKMAEKHYLKINKANQPMYLQSLVQLAEMYLQTDSMDSLSNIMPELSSKLDKLKASSKSKYYRGRLYQALLDLKLNRFQSAKNKLVHLRDEMQEFYKLDFQGVSLMHDVMRDIAVCEMKLGQHQEAIRNLEETKGWVKVCEGRSAGLAFTERLIAQVHRSQGRMADYQSLWNSQQELSRTVPKYQFDYLKNTSVMIDIDPAYQDDVEVSTAKSASYGGKNSIQYSAPKIDQSAVSFDVNPVPKSSNSYHPPASINQSVVTINLDNQIPASKPQPIDQSKVQIQM